MLFPKPEQEATGLVIAAVMGSPRAGEGPGAPWGQGWGCWAWSSEDRDSRELG